MVRIGQGDVLGQTVDSIEHTPGSQRSHVFYFTVCVGIKIFPWVGVFLYSQQTVRLRLEHNHESGVTVMKVLR